MTQEEKAKAYDEALERARALRQEAIDKEYAIDYVKDYEAIFPELAESEDEKTWKWLLDYAIEMIAGLESDISLSTYDGIKGHDPDAEAELAQWQKARAYLEKQKERKPAEWSDDIEQAAARYERENRQCLLSSVDIVNAFIEGAKWMANQMPQPEDTVIFQKGVAEG